MKVLHIMPFWGMGGIQQTVFNLCKFKGGTQPSLLVTATRREATWDARFDDLGIPTTSTNNSEILSLMNAADIINYHTCGSHQKPYEHLIRKTSTPCVLTLHWHTKMPVVPQPIICVSRHTARLQHSKNKVFTIHSGIDLERFSPRPQIEDKKEIIITRVCRFDKCARYFWRSMYAVLKLIPQAKLWIVGEKGNSTQRVKFWGYRDDVPDILAQSDIFAYAPYPKVGSFDLVVLEAIAMGLPCVLSDAPCVTELVEHLKTGIITPFGNAKAFAYAVCKLALNSKLRRWIGENGIQTAKRFDAREMSKKYYAVYTVLLANEQTSQ